jgi:hypothetical protein
MKEKNEIRYRIDYNLLFSFILGFISYKIFLELRIQSMALTLTGYLFEDGFQEKFDEKRDGNSNTLTFLIKILT